MKKYFWGILLAIVVAQGAAAESTSSSIKNEPETLSTNLPSVFSEPHLMLGLKSYNDSGRPSDFDNPSGLRVKSKNEYYAGVKSQTGFGIYGQAVEYVKQYGSADLNRFNPGDPSVTLVHPVYEDSRLKITGALREYFPVSDHSQSVGQYQQAYYNNINYKLPNRFDLFNQITPRNFVQAKYADSDAKFYVEAWTIVTRPVKEWLRLGAGQHFQYEAHSATPTGNTLEVFPMADFIINRNIFVGPRLYLPVSVQNSVYDAPKKVSLSEAQAELYFQATL
jgi:hypothetical protein